MLRSTSLRVLRPEDLPAVTDVLARDPVADVFVASRVEAVGLDPARLGGEMWGFAVDGRLESLCHAGANLVPVQAGPEAVRAFADRARRQGRRCASIVGERDAVAGTVGRAGAGLGAGPRGPRPAAADGDRRAAGRCRPTRWCGGSGRTSSTSWCRPAWRCSPRRSASRRWAPTAARPTAAGSPSWCATGQGLRPDRGRPGRLQGRDRLGQLGRLPGAGGVGAAGPARPRAGRARDGGGRRAGPARLAPVVSLYVNDFNQAARATYRRVGFADVGEFMSVLF